MKQTIRNNMALWISAVSLVAATVWILLLPRQVTLSIGDDAARRHAIGRMGYPLSHFAVAGKVDAKGRREKPAAYSIGEDWHLLIWHRDRIERMTHFLYVSRGEHRYGDWVHVRNVDSFTVSRRPVVYYFVGLGVAFTAGLGLAKYTRTFYGLFGVYCAWSILAVVALSFLVETLALDHCLRYVGVASGAIFAQRLGVLRRNERE